MKLNALNLFEENVRTLNIRIYVYDHNNKNKNNLLYTLCYVYYY